MRLSDFLEEHLDRIRKLLLDIRHPRSTPLVNLRIERVWSQDFDHLRYYS